MYVKIVEHLEDEKGVSSSRGSLEEKVVPSEHHMFECLEATYRKVTVDSITEFYERMVHIETVRVIISVPEKGPFEFVQCKTVIREGGERILNETLIARNCILYLMNNDGKTIDSMVCR